MAHKKLSRVRALPDASIAKLGSRGVLTCKDFLGRSPLELMGILDVTYPRIQHLIATVSNACAPPSRTALCMYQERVLEEGGTKLLSTSIPRLDQVLRGGLPPSTITEVSGPPGCGKTQFCIMLSVHSALPEAAGGRGSPVVYIDTEGAFSAERLLEMARSRLDPTTTTPPTDDRANLPYDDFDPPQGALLQLASSVHVVRHTTGRGFLECLRGLDLVLARTGAGLLVVDSVASLVRKEYDVSTGKGAMERTSSLLKQSARLKYLAETFGIQVVVTNQIVTKLSPELSPGTTGNCDTTARPPGGVVTSALGNAWYHSINTRITLDHRHGNQRALTIIKSPFCERSTMLVNITRAGFIADDQPTNSDELEEAALEESAILSTHYRGFPVEFPGQLS